MFLKSRSESMELLKFRSLNSRSTLSTKEKKHYIHLEKGYQGEVMFDQLTTKLNNDLYILNDLNLEYNNAVCQIDSLIISQETIYPFEIKNFEGDYLYDSESFYILPAKEEIKNPLDQLKRSNSLLRPLLKKQGIYLPVEGSVTFVNPGFTLYQAPLNAPIFYPTQLHQLMKKLNQIPSKLNGRHKKLADQLLAMNQTESPFAWKPIYTYGGLKKGTICPKCYCFMISIRDKKLVCMQCGCEESVESGVLRSVKELKLLFPDTKITTNGIHEWCGVIGSTKIVRRILFENFTGAGYGRWFYYE